jgi:6,7-dimethyl-8-ribityllumazine synthase
MTDVKALQGELNARDLRFGIVLSRFNELVGEQLLAGAVETLTEHGAERSRIDVVRVPGAFEIPPTLKVLAVGAKYDALIALGAVIRGDTPHFDYVAGECARGVAQVSAEHALPVAFGVLTVNTLEQALARAGATQGGNKGAEAALVAIEMANLFKRLRAP